jgi:hypothetical protein
MVRDRLLASSLYITTIVWAAHASRLCGYLIWCAVGGVLAIGMSGNLGHQHPPLLEVDRALTLASPWLAGVAVVSGALSRLFASLSTNEPERLDDVSRIARQGIYNGLVFFGLLAAGFLVEMAFLR